MLRGGGPWDLVVNAVYILTIGLFRGCAKREGARYLRFSSSVRGSNQGSYDCTHAIAGRSHVSSSLVYTTSQSEFTRNQGPNSCARKQNRDAACSRRPPRWHAALKFSCANNSICAKMLMRQLIKTKKPKKAPATPLSFLIDLPSLRGEKKPRASFRAHVKVSG